MDGKECTQCYSFLPLEKFYVQEKTKDGRASECKECGRERKREYVKNNLERVRAQARKSYKKRKTELLIKRKEYYSSEHGSSVIRLWREKNRYRQAVWGKTSRSKPRNKIKSAMTARIYSALKHGRTSSWGHCLNYTVEELKNHLESKFVGGMAWDNYGYYGWHIDHKIPVSYFNFSSPQDAEFKKCWALDNLQPMWGKENLSKHAKLIYLEGGT